MRQLLSAFFGVASYDGGVRKLNELKKAIPVDETVCWHNFSHYIGFANAWSAPGNERLFAAHNKTISASLLSQAHRGKIGVYGAPDTSVPETIGPADLGIAAIVTEAASKFGGHSIYIGRDIYLSYRTHDVIDTIIANTRAELSFARDYLHGATLMLRRNEDTAQTMQDMFVNPNILWELFEPVQKKTRLNPPTPRLEGLPGSRPT